MKIANDLIFTNIDTITAFDVTTGKFMFVLDELTSGTIDHNEETQDITGKNGRLLSRSKRNKGVVISGTNGIVSGGMLELQTGGDYTSDNDAEIMWSETLTVQDNAATTTWKAIGDSTLHNEIVELYVKNGDGTLARELTQDGTAASGKFTYNASTKALGFYVDTTSTPNVPDLPNGTEIYVCYRRKVAATILENDSEKYSGKASLFVDGLAEDKCGNMYRVQFYFPKVDFSGDFSLEFGDQQVAHSFEATAMAGACGEGTKYYTYTVFGANTPDYTSG